MLPKARHTVRLVSEGLYIFFVNILVRKAVHNIQISQNPAALFYFFPSGCSKVNPIKSTAPAPQNTKYSGRTPSCG